MSKSQSEFPSPKKLCRALHSGLARKLMLLFRLFNEFLLLFRMEMEAAVKHRTQFYIEDAMTMEYPENFYDVVYRWGCR